MLSCKALQSTGELWRKLKRSSKEWRKQAREYCEKQELTFKTLHKGQVKYVIVRLEKIESHFGVVQQNKSLPYVEHKTRLVAVCDGHKIEL